MTQAIPGAADPDSDLDALITQSPLLSELHGKLIVVKYGGNAMTDPSLKQGFAQDIARLKAAGVHPVVVHGGGPQISQALDRLGKKGEFVHGMRITDHETIQVVQWVLGGEVQQDIVLRINQAGGRALGLTGLDGAILHARRQLIRDPQNPDQTVDAGLVGEICQVNPALITDVAALGYIPVVSPIACDPEDGTVYNINADVAAASIAQALGAHKLLLMTNIAGVLDSRGELMPHLDEQTISRCKQDGTISGGMIPKIDSALHAARNGVGAVHIMDGRVPRSLLRELLSEEQLGTMITA